MIKKGIILLCLCLSFSCFAADICIGEKLSESEVFYQNKQRYVFKTYTCHDDNEEFNKPDILMVKGDDFDVSFKNVIGMRGGVNIYFTNWNKKPSINYSNSSSTRTEAYLTLNLKNQSVFIDCAYIYSRLKNYMNNQYSICGINKLIANGLNIEDVIPDFYLSPLYNQVYYANIDETLANQNFDVFIGKINNISIYRRYLSLDDYKSEKYKVIISTQDKQFQFNSSDIYQRITNYAELIGLDIVNNNNIVFYDQNTLLNILKTSNEKRNITSYIQREKTILYNSPNLQDDSKMYLVKSDMVHILDEYIDENNQLWFQIKYKSKKIGKITKWILVDAFNNFDE